MKQSADLGDALGAYELSNFYFRGWGATETNRSNYRFWRAKAASLGATDAQYFMGQAYRTGDRVPENADKSLLWYRKAAAKNHPEALYDLALHYLDDKADPTSLKMANDLMIRAANLGHREAQFQCAMSCFRGDAGLAFEKGREWLARAAENGWPKAEFCLFQLYYRGALVDAVGDEHTTPDHFARARLGLAWPAGLRVSGAVLVRGFRSAMEGAQWREW
jgi:TPR repeat protein